MIGWAAMSFSVAGLLLNTQKAVSCWPMWCIGSVCWIIYGITLKELSVVCSNAVFLCFNLYGWWSWSRS